MAAHGKSLPGATKADLVDRLIKRRYTGDGAWPGVLKALWRAGDVQESSAIRTPPPDRMLKARLYVDLAQSYERAGLMAQALESWRTATITAGIYIPDDELLRFDRKQGWRDVGTQ